MSTTPVDLDFSTFTPLDSGPSAAAKLRQSVAYGVQQNPDEYAKLLKQQQVTGMAPELAKPLWGETQNAIDVERLQPEQMAVSHPRTAAWASNPDNAAVAGVDEIQRLARIEHHADTMNAYTPTWRDKVSDASQSAFEFLGGSGSLKKNFFDFPLFRLGIGTLRGTEEAGGDIGSFFGIHGDNGGPNSLQRSARTLEPGQFGERENTLDKVAAQAGPMIPAVLASGGTSLLARTLGLSDKAAKIFAGLAVAGMFSSDQGGSTYSSLRESGASEYDSRLAANRVAAMTAPANALFGATEVVPLLRNNPLLSSLGIGGAAGASGQLAQNVVTGRPALQGAGLAALQGAAAQGGMHLGMGFLEHFAAAVGESQASQLRTRAPEAFAEATKMNFAGAESLRIPADRFTEYFKSKGIDPAAAADELGSGNYAEAFLSGGDVEVRPESYLTNLAEEHQNALLHDVVDPSTGMTARDVQEAGKELEDWANGGAADKLVEDMQAADAETQATPEWQKVYSDLKQRYADTGESEAEADSHASLQANAIAYFAKNAGMKPDELLALHEPTVVAGEEPASGTLSQMPLEEGAGDNSTQPKQETPAGAINGIPIHTLDADQIKGSPHALNEYLNDLGLSETDTRKGNTIVLRGLNEDELGKKTLRKSRVWDDGKPTKRQLNGTSGVLYAGAFDMDEPDASGVTRAIDNAKRYGGSDYIAVVRGDLATNEDFNDPGEAVVKNPEVVAYIRKSPLSDTHPAPAQSADVLYQPQRLDDQKKRNIEVAKIQGEMLKGEPWQQTLDEYRTSMKGQRIEKIPPFNREGTLQQMHEDRISAALQGGRAVPEKILEELVARNQYSKTAKQAKAELEARAARAEEQPRGWFRVLPDGRFEIGKTSIGDLSTFVHEPAHAYLELFRELTQREGASEPLKDDFRKLTEWLGTTPEEAYKNGFTREQHEKWASANEQYVSEGKAPTAGLRRAFHNFAVWLGKIYDRARTLKVDLSPDIRGVMDRLYAGEEAVDRAGQGTGEPLFASPEEAGWTEQEFRNYAEAKGVAVDKAREQVRREMNEAAQRDRTQAWREEKVNVREAVTQQVDSQREYTAIRSLRRGALDDGTELKLNRDALVRQFGEERVAALQQAHRGLYRLEGGSDPEAAAELLGFDSADEMLRKLTEAPRRSKAIEDATRDVMTARHGDIRYDGSLDDKARLAVENDDRAKGLHQELAALKRRVSMLETRAAKTKAAMRAITLAPLDAYQKAAHEMIEAKPIADIQPHRYLDASRKYSREAFDAVRKGSVDHAADAKHKELLNHFLFREASAARDYVEKFERYVKQSVQSKGIQQRLGLAGSDFRNQFNWLLARYGLGPAPEQGRYEMPSRLLRAWADERFDAMQEPAVEPHILDSMGYKDYRNVPLAEVRDLHDALINIKHLALQQYKAIKEGSDGSFNEWRDAAVEKLRASWKSQPERFFERNATGTEKVIDFLQGIDAANMRQEFMFHMYDGGDPNGPWHDLWKMYADAKGYEFALKAEATAKLQDAIRNMPDELRKRLWMEKVHIDGVTEDLTRYDIASMVFNMGNEGNLDRLRKTFIDRSYDPRVISQIPGLLTREELQFIQDTTDMLKPYGDRMNAMEKELTGLPPKMVEATPYKVRLADGSEVEMAGGYYPIHYDSRYTLKGYDDDAGKSAQSLMEKGYVRATLSRGYTKERSGYGGPLLLDFERTLSAHLDKVTKDLAFRKFLLAGNKLLRDPEIRKAVRETAGPAYEEQLMPWLRSTANDHNGSLDQGLGRMSGLVRQARTNFVIAKLCYNTGTMLRQFTHVPRLMLFTKPESFTQAFFDFVKSPRETTKMIQEASPNEMRFRGDNLDRDYRDKLHEMGARNGLSKQVISFGYAPMRYIDHLISSSLWLSVYRDGMVKYAELPRDQAHNKATHEADSAVRMGIGTGTAGDLPPIMRNNDYWKLVTTLHGFENVNYNIERLEVHNFRQGQSGAPRLGYAIAMGLMIPAILGPLVVGDHPKDGENPAWWAIKEGSAYALGLLPLLRGHGDPVTELITKVNKTAKEIVSDKTDKDWTGAMIDALETAGELRGVPGSSQAIRGMRYAHRASQGKVQDPSVWGAVVRGR